MIVTDIVEMTKSRSRISIDGEFAFVLYKGELRHFHLQKGEEIKESDYERIMTEILPKRAKPIHSSQSLLNCAPRTTACGVRKPSSTCWRTPPKSTRK